jgi:hypothetical protein
MASLDNLAQGRLSLALGSGLPLRLAQMNIPFENAPARVGESIDQIRTLWRGERLVLNDKVPPLVPMFPPPKRIPIYIAAYTRAYLELAGEKADGYLARPMESIAAFQLMRERVLDSAQRHGAVATCGKARIEPNGVNAIPSLVTVWIDARGPVGDDVHEVVAELTALAEAAGGTLAEESWADATPFDARLRDRLTSALGSPPVLATGAGHDAGILAALGIATGMLFVRNPTGVSHSPAESAEREDCLLGVAALTHVLTELAGAPK